MLETFHPATIAPPDARFQARPNPGCPDRHGIQAEAEAFGQLAAVVDLHALAADVIARDDATIQRIELLEALLQADDELFPCARGFRSVRG